MESLDSKTISLWIMATLYTIAGILHFVIPKFYLRIMPPWIPYHKLMVQLSGIAEIALGIGLFFPPTRILSAWGVVLLLIAVFPANLYHFQSRTKKDPPTWALILRLPLQLVLIYWAYTFTN
ncbi:DoxX family protein [Leptospira wolffii]|uniref:DoxX family protein n=1 Tax=Leptospira wolffii TaxID=409998 RepID=A0A2M9Z990_9LEPT|nr:DoxX family protein [Leptospira wolffii]EPG65649.1 DoxX-like family protein [Leptospira wolffii serovar Khorat str. Khorat-H2]PJZ65006.1 DoxX-like family protein [Leptospira wolffii]TGK58091.1 DoxX-like family protein [Leptospira wolffii]TGK68770.1 DoxX-like family protein [Leptospira wolffii]TGK76390.1 DoxX-like family protein [Leptospira wolffii]